MKRKENGYWSDSEKYVLSRGIFIRYPALLVMGPLVFSIQTYLLLKATSILGRVRLTTADIFSVHPVNEFIIYFIFPTNVSFDNTKALLDDNNSTVGYDLLLVGSSLGLFVTDWET